jgi:hypothetical protein
MSRKQDLSRRDFLKLTAAGAAGLALGPFEIPPAVRPLADFPAGQLLGRVTSGKWDLKARPDASSETVGVVMDDAVLPWLREVVGNYSPYRINRRWIETPEGYIWGAYFQPVWHRPNEPLAEVPQTSIGPGMWVEVTVPYVDGQMINPPPRHAYFKWRYEHDLPLRFYYSQILWVDAVRTASDGRILYRVNEKYGNRGDVLWADARAFRPITPEEIAPISPEVENKKIIVYRDVNRQYLSCFEDEREVYFCRLSSGRLEEHTPLGQFKIYRKLVSLHMGGTAVQGIDVVGVGWTCLYTANGVAIHSTWWHNNYGEPESAGCINVSPDDCKWIFRWTTPLVEYDPGEKTVTDYSGTPVIVRQS